eukprot:CAMPEP_0171731060 /NCGR_PEP_ID=MMETSP0991-20121206/28699_1 /TAXON_ID=483369 /ORGANISM="non described non described, Strain CCMP2098" /LENGTH=60 /DNA_ID=CAMNT_0012325987 /DNA_START=1094 /DNA_END=1276 /DNA_ORIENTATION=-
MARSSALKESFFSTVRTDFTNPSGGALQKSFSFDETLFFEENPVRGGSGGDIPKDVNHVL